MTTEHTVVRSGKSKRKPFNSNVADYLLGHPSVLNLPLAATLRGSHFAICVIGGEQNRFNQKETAPVNASEVNQCSGKSVALGHPITSQPIGIWITLPVLRDDRNGS
jgi:hypothetical protein